MDRISFPIVFPQLATERLILKEIIYKDKYNMFENFSDEDVAKWFFEKPLTKIDQIDPIINNFIKSFKNKKGLTWAIVLKEDNSYVGTCGYEQVEINSFGEIGFDLAKKYWRKGLMSEALTAVIN